MVWCGTIKRQQLGDEYVYLLLDGVSQRVRTSVGVKRRVVLCAIGIRIDASRGDDSSMGSPSTVLGA